MILKNIKEGNVQDLRFDHLLFKVVSDVLSVNLINLHTIQGIVIRANEGKLVRQILHQIRSKKDPQVYLLPVYLESRSLFKQMGNEVDGYLMEGISPLNNTSGDAIRSRIDLIKNDGSHIQDHQDQMILRAMQYAYTREIDLLPYRDRHSPLGYYYPFLSSVVSEKEFIHIMNKFQKLSGKSFLKGRLENKVNLCRTCQGSYLNFHETCSKCASLDLTYENLVHHFRCAYIGPESDFLQGDQLICPKCDKTLKHIGIDYDKPAEVASCNHCTHTSQETKMKASCIDCGETNALSQLKTLEIRSYSLTSHAEHLITMENGDFEERPDEIHTLKIVPSPIFDLLLDQEKSRSALRKNTPSFVCEINIQEKLYQDLSDEYRNRLSREILGIMETYLRPIDILCAKGTGNYSFILPECTNSEAHALYLLVLDNLNKILADNLTGGDSLVEGQLRKL